MKVKQIFRVVALVILSASAVMAVPLFVALFCGENVLPLMLSLLVGVTFSVLTLFFCRSHSSISLTVPEGCASTVLSWLVVTLIGSLPFYLSGSVPSFTDAFFETMSGFTTTGATILTDIESLPKSLLLWRSLTHLLGGMGIIVLSLAIMPFLGAKSLAMYKAEVPGVTAGKVAPRLHSTALLLWLVYVGLALAETVLLMFGGMTLFDAFCHSCSTVATGGFSTKNASVAHFNSSYIQAVITVFMFLSGVNFSLFFLLPSGKFREFLADEEFRTYAGIIAASFVMIWLFTGRNAIFSIVSVITTTGFITDDFDTWPDFCRFILLMLMFVGACGGSTGGGFKVSRIVILFRQMKCELLRLLHPRAVICPRMDGQVIRGVTLGNVSAFLVLYLLLTFLAVMISTACGVDLVSSITGVITCISNVGPGLGNLGPVRNFAWLPDTVKWTLSLCMLCGRLELCAVFMIILPEKFLWR